MAVNPFYPKFIQAPARYYKAAPDFSFVTASHTYQDGSVSYNELADTCRQEWELVFQFDRRDTSDAARMAAFDKHYAERRTSRSFYFREKDGIISSGVFYKDYQKSHEAHKSWIQIRRIALLAPSYQIPATDTPPPGVPANLKATPAGTNAFVLSWNASSGGAAGYRVRFEGVNGVVYDVGNTLSFPIGSLPANKTVSFEVLAYNAAGVESAYSIPVYGQTGALFSVDLASPLAGETISGAYAFTAATVGGAGGVTIQSVEYFAGSQSLGVVASGAGSSWSLSVNTTAIANGFASILARATDTAGASYQSAIAKVKVANAVIYVPPPVQISGYTTLNFNSLKFLDEGNSELFELFNFTMTFISELQAGMAPAGYTGNFTPVRNVDFLLDFSDLVKAINFAVTIATDKQAGRTFSDYVIANFDRLKSLDNDVNSTDDLAECLRVLMTIADDLGATPA
jgi:hypothetical protein